MVGLDACKDRSWWVVVDVWWGWVPARTGAGGWLLAFGEAGCLQGQELVGGCWNVVRLDACKDRSWWVVVDVWWGWMPARTGAGGWLLACGEAGCLQGQELVGGCWHVVRLDACKDRSW